MPKFRLATILMLPLVLCCVAAEAQSKPADPLLAYASAPEAPCSAGYSRNNEASPSAPYRVPQSKEKQSDLPPLVGRRKPLESRRMFLSALAVGVRVDSLGFGAEVATSLSRSFNLRAGANLLNYGYAFGVDGVNYNAQIQLHSGQASLDWFPFHGAFHIGPGVIYFNNQLNAVLSAPAGKDFELGNSDFTNSVSNPVHGTATIGYARKIAPALIAGFGNVIPRSGRHFSVPIEVGIAYMGPAQINLNLQGMACQGGACFNMATNPDYRQSLQQEQSDLNESLKKFQVYPIVSTGLSYRF